MEHRWGTRHPLRTSVRLDARSHCLSRACLHNASSSGAYIETETVLPLWTRIYIELGWGTFGEDTRRIAAYVVRQDEHGIGIEWCEFASPAILELIESMQAAEAFGLDHHPAVGGARIRARSRTAREQRPIAAAPASSASRLTNSRFAL